MPTLTKAGDRAGTSPGDDGAVYRIRVEGRLGAHWAERLSGTTLTVEEAPETTTASQLTGRLPDQAALLGVLEHLCALGVKLLVVQRLDTDADTGESCRPVHGELNR